MSVVCSRHCEGYGGWRCGGTWVRGLLLLCVDEVVFGKWLLRRRCREKAGVGSSNPVSHLDQELQVM